MIKKARRRFSMNSRWMRWAWRSIGDIPYQDRPRLSVECSVLDRWCRQYRQQVSDTLGRQEDDRDAEIKKLCEEVRKLQIGKNILKG